MSGSECQRRTMFGRSACRFEPRYDTPLVDVAVTSFFRQTTFRYSEGQLAEVEAEPLPHKTYVRDVCVRCGKTVERERPAA